MKQKRLNFSTKQSINLSYSALAIFGAGISSGTLHAETNPGDIKWNVVVLMTDMQNVHYIGSDHQSRENISTPNLDKLGRDGMVFRKAYDAFPVCAPTRASLLTGTYPMKHEQHSNSTHLLQAGTQGKTPSLAHLFRNNGYNTAMFGKQHSNIEEFENMVDGTIAGKNVFAGWNFRLFSESDGTAPANAINPTLAEKNKANNYMSQLNAYADQLKDEYKNRYNETVVGRPMLQWEKDTAANSGVSARGLNHSADLSDGLHAYATLDYLETYAGVRNDTKFNIDRSKPVFLFLSFHKPHYGFTVPLLCDGTEFWHMYSGRPQDNNSTYLRNGVPVPVIVPTPITDSLFYEDPTSQYQYNREKHNNYQFAKAKYSGLISWIDHMMGKVIDKLAVLDDPNNPGKKMSETTIVVFTTDHGDMMGQKQRINKNVSYEGSARVPFLIRMPGVLTPGQKSDILINHVDMFPTLAGLVGLGDKLNTSLLDGKDLSQVIIANNATAGPQRTFTVNASNANSYPGQIYTRTQNYKFTRWNDNSKVGNQPAMLLFDMDNDPYETTNLAYNPSFRSIVIEESNACDAFMEKFYPTLAPIVIPELSQYTLSTSFDNNKGTITSSHANGTVTENAVVKLKAEAKPGYKFIGWSGDLTIKTNSAELVMTSNKTVTANFAIDDNKSRITFETPGNGTWTVPAGVSSITINAWGAGGAGGSAYCGTATTNTQLRGGGGAGGSFTSTTTSVTSGQIINYTVGAGGVGASSGFAHQSIGQSGGATFAELNSTTLVSAIGGAGGENVSGINIIYGGAGGVAPKTGNIGSVSYYGGNGGTAGAGGTGGGGGSAGAEGDGGNAEIVTAGAAGLSGGAAGGTGTNLTNQLPTNGENPGGGGAGATVRNNSPFSANNTHKTGGNGGNGKLIIAYEVFTGVAKIEAEEPDLISLFPNPAFDKLFIQTNGISISKIEIVDLSGKLVFSQSQINQNESLEISELANGIYFVKAYTANKLLTIKLIKK